MVLNHHDSPVTAGQAREWHNSLINLIHRAGNEFRIALMGAS